MTHMIVTTIEIDTQFVELRDTLCMWSTSTDQNKYSMKDDIKLTAIKCIISCIKNHNFMSYNRSNPLGQPINMAEADDRIFGVVLMNDCKYSI